MRESRQEHRLHVPFRRSGTSGLHLPVLSAGLGQSARGPQRCLRAVVRQVMEVGINSFDITAPSAAAEDLHDEAGYAFAPWLGRREEILVTARIGVGTRPRAFGGFSSRWQIMAGLDGLLRRTGLGHLDILYVHRFAPDTPVEETTAALADAVRQGKALYAGLSALAPVELVRANALLTELGVPAVSYQASYSLIDRWAENHMFDVLGEQGLGATACAPLAHGLLTTPRASGPGRRTALLMALARIAAARGQSVEQLAVSWALRDPRVTSVLLTSGDPGHLATAVDAVWHTRFAESELDALDACCQVSPAVNRIDDEWFANTTRHTPG